MAYTADLTPDPVEQWAPGKIFKVTSDRISLITSPADVSSNLMPGNYLSFIGFSPIASMTGVDDTLVLLSSEKGDTIMGEKPADGMYCPQHYILLYGNRNVIHQGWKAVSPTKKTLTEQDGI